MLWCQRGWFNCQVLILLLLLSGVNLLHAQDTAQNSSATKPSETVRFVVYLPNKMPANSTQPPKIYIAGNHPKLGNWQPNGLILEPATDGSFVAEVELPRDFLLQFKVTQGTWTSVETNDKGLDIPNRKFRVTASTADDVEPRNRIEVRVANWTSNQPPRSTVIGKLILHEQFSSEFLPDKRNVNVWLPPDYDSSEQKRYSVLYLQDGQNLFDKTTAFNQEWRVDETLTDMIQAEEIDSLIVVGVWNTPARINEYTWTVDSRTNRGGQGADYVKFITNELKPFIDQNYRTNPDRSSTWISGSSLGGLLALQAILARPDVFGAAASFSPSLGWDDEQLLRQLEEQHEWTPPVRLWISMGTLEGGSPELQQRNVARTIRLGELFAAQGLARDTDFMVQLFDGSKHDETAWAMQFPAAMRYLHTTQRKSESNSKR